MPPQGMSPEQKERVNTMWHMGIQRKDIAQAVGATPLQIKGYLQSIPRATLPPSPQKKLGRLT